MGLKSEIESKLGIPVKVKAGMPGSLDVYLDRERVYSKTPGGRMPQNADILAAIEQRSAVKR